MRTLHDDDYSDTVVYDTFRHAANLLSGTLIALNRWDRERDPAQAERWRDEARQVWHQRDTTDTEDRTAQIAATDRWQARYTDLKDER